MKTAQPGTPGQASARHAPSPEQVEYGTSHISIVDSFGNAIAMTTTIEDQFGARQMVRGFMLNNELTDFSFAPADAQGRPIANRVQPGKRPRSSMAPTLVFDKASGQLPPPLVQALQARGHEVREQDMTSGLQAIQRTPTGFFGGADPRREGIVMGD
jgi:gamma-glutamyltranspeptidase/glutathione hydrolase